MVRLRGGAGAGGMIHVGVIQAAFFDREEEGFGVGRGGVGVVNDQNQRGGAKGAQAQTAVPGGAAHARRIQVQAEEHRVAGQQVEGKHVVVGRRIDDAADPAQARDRLAAVGQVVGFGFRGGCATPHLEVEMVGPH